MNLNQVLNAIQHHNSAVAAGLSSTARAADTGASGGTTAGDDTSISGTDFMTLLVSELKNQDPTSDTDPNTYVDQLVQVNSLQQLISINQGITSLDSSTAPAAQSSTAPAHNASPLDSFHAAGVSQHRPAIHPHGPAV